MKNKKSCSQTKLQIKKLPNCKIKLLPTPLKMMMMCSYLINSKSLEMKTLKSMKTGDRARVNTHRTLVRTLKTFFMMQKSLRGWSEKNFHKFTKPVRIWRKSWVRCREDVRYAPWDHHAGTLRIWSKTQSSRRESTPSFNKFRISKA